MSTHAHEDLEQALGHSQVVDITTIGRRSASPRRIEIFMHNIGGRLYISGMPRPEKRDWLYNLEADPRFKLHLKASSVQADLDATARVIDTEPERLEILPHVAKAWRRNDLEVMMRYSPLIEVLVDRGTTAT